MAITREHISDLYKRVNLDLLIVTGLSSNPIHQATRPAVLSTLIQELKKQPDQSASNPLEHRLRALDLHNSSNITVFLNDFTTLLKQIAETKPPADKKSPAMWIISTLKPPAPVPTAAIAGETKVSPSLIVEPAAATSESTTAAHAVARRPTAAPAKRDVTHEALLDDFKKEGIFSFLAAAYHLAAKTRAEKPANEKLFSSLDALIRTLTQKEGYRQAAEELTTIKNLLPLALESASAVDRHIIDLAKKFLEEISNPETQIEKYRHLRDGMHALVRATDEKKDADNAAFFQLIQNRFPISAPSVPLSTTPMVLTKLSTDPTHYTWDTWNDREIEAAAQGNKLLIQQILNVRQHMLDIVQREHKQIPFKLHIWDHKILTQEEVTDIYDRQHRTFHFLIKAKRYEQWKKNAAEAKAAGILILPEQRNERINPMQEAIILLDTYQNGVFTPRLLHKLLRTETLEPFFIQLYMEWNTTHRAKPPQEGTQWLVNSLIILKNALQTDRENFAPIVLSGMMRGIPSNTMTWLNIALRELAYRARLELKGTNDEWDTPFTKQSLFTLVCEIGNSLNLQKKGEALTILYKYGIITLQDIANEAQKSTWDNSDQPCQPRLLYHVLDYEDGNMILNDEREASLSEVFGSFNIPRFGDLFVALVAHVPDSADAAPAGTPVTPVTPVTIPPPPPPPAENDETPDATPSRRFSRGA